MGAVNFPKTDNTTVTTPAVDNKKVFMDTDGSFYTKDENGVVTPFGGGGGSFEDRIYYDEIPAPLNSGYPLADLQGSLKRYAPKLASNSINFAYWFTNTNFMFINTTTKVVTDNLKFADESEMTAWINNNLSNDGSYFTESGYFINYDIVDSSINPITKVNGFNSAFSSLTGGKYKSHIGNASETEWSGINGMLARAYNDMFPTLLSPIKDLDFNIINNKKAVWLAQNYRRYNKSLINSTGSQTIINYDPSSTNRWIYNDTTSSFEALDKNTDPIWEMTDVFWATLNFNKVPGYDIYPRSVNSSKQIITRSIKNGNRGLVIYGYQSQANPNKKGILIKPMGIDVVIINDIDFSTYQLEILQKATGEQQNFDRIKVISDYTDLTSGGIGHDTWSGRLTLLPNDYYFKINEGFGKSVSYGGLTIPNIYFRLRDKTTFKTSKISRAYIKNINTNNSGGIIPFARIVQTDKK